MAVDNNIADFWDLQGILGLGILEQQLRLCPFYYVDIL